MSFPQKNASSFDHPPSYEELLAEYQKAEEANPASLHYKRHLVRPALHPVRALLFCLLALCASALLAFLSFLLFEGVGLAIVVGGTVLLLLILLFLKRILIWCIRFYQRFASSKTRERCRFEPSCSEYMILALQKYGVFRGVQKGVRRLLRCKPPNGGFDLP